MALGISESEYASVQLTFAQPGIAVLGSGFQGF